MAKPKVKVVLNRANVRQQILLGPGMYSYMAGVAQRMADDDIHTGVSTSQGAKARHRARAWGSMSAESRDGSLTRAFGRAT